MKKGRFITPVTLLSFAILAAIFAGAGYGDCALWFYYYWHPAKRIPGDVDLGLFNTVMTAVMASLFALVSVLLLWWRRRIQQRLRGDRALGFPVALESRPPDSGSDNRD